MPSNDNTSHPLQLERNSDLDPDSLISGRDWDAEEKLNVHWSAADVRAARKDYSDKYLRAKDYRGYVESIDGHLRTRPFFEVYHLMSPSDFWECLAHVWSNIEQSYRERWMWLNLFRCDCPHREKLMQPEEHEAFAAFPEELTIHRGYGKGRAKSGISWTLSEEKAHWFATVYLGAPRRRSFFGHQGHVPGMVVTGKCHKRDVLAYFTERKEAEIVIDPRNVFSKRARPAKTAEIAQPSAAP